MAFILTNPLRSFSAITDQSDLIPAGALGRIFEDDNGNCYKLIQANGAISQYDVCRADSSAGDNYTVEAASSSDMAVGVAMADLADNEYGFVQVRGLSDCSAISTATAEHLAYTGASGYANSNAIGSTTVTADMLAVRLGEIITAPVYSASVQITPAKIRLAGLL